MGKKKIDSSEILKDLAVQEIKKSIGFHIYDYNRDEIGEKIKQKQTNIKTFKDMHDLNELYEDLVTCYVDDKLYGMIENDDFKKQLNDLLDKDLKNSVVDEPIEIKIYAQKHWLIDIYKNKIKKIKKECHDLFKEWFDYFDKVWEEM